MDGQVRRRSDFNRRSIEMGEKRNAYRRILVGKPEGKNH
jgi:hypothetical protein